ncbi:MAG TPA: hypothetical protein VIJ94_05165 [Caulobacteraceae bacterium]
MAATAHLDRRALLVAASALTAAAAMPSFAAAGRLAGGAVAVFEAEERSARTFVRGRGAPLAIDGDRIRFARRLFGEQRPSKVVGVTRYADFLMLAESAREHGYRATLEGRAPPDGAALFVWTAEPAEAPQPLASQGQENRTCADTMAETHSTSDLAS